MKFDIKHTITILLLLFQISTVMAQIKTDTFFWIKEWHRLDESKSKTNLKDAEKYLLMAYEIASKSEDQLIYYTLPRLSRDLIRVGNKTKIGLHPPSFSENNITTFQRIEYSGLVSTLSIEDLVNQFDNINESQQWQIIERLVDEGHLSTAEKLTHSSTLNSRKFAGVLIEYNEDINTVQKYFFQEPINTIEIRGTAFDRYIGNNLKTNNINLSTANSLFKTSNTSDKVKFKIIAQNIGYSQHYEELPKYLDSIGRRDRLRIFESLSKDLKKIENNDQKEYLLEILSAIDSNRKVQMELALLRNEDEINTSLFNELYNELTEVNQQNLSDQSIKLIKKNKNNLTLINIKELLTSRDETNVLLKLAKRLVEINKYTEAIECVEHEEFDYHYSVIEDICLQDETKIAKEWTNKFYKDDDKLSAYRYILMSLYRQNKKEEIESYIATVNDYWKMDYYHTLAKQCMGIKNATE